MRNVVYLELKICRRPILFEHNCTCLTSVMITAESWDITYQQDGAQPHFHHHVREYLDDKTPRRWTGRVSRDDSPLLA